MKEEFSKARAQYLQKLERGGTPSPAKHGSFLFLINSQEACEKAFVNILGLADTNGHKSKTWNHERSKFLGDAEDDSILEDVKISRRAKRDHAYSYIKRVVDSEITDRSAFRNQANTIFLPYRKARFFYGEYDFYCVHNKIVERGRESTFGRALDDIREAYEKEGKKIKFNSGKGTSSSMYFEVKAIFYVNFLLFMHVCMIRFLR